MCFKYFKYFAVIFRSRQASNIQPSIYRLVEIRKNLADQYKMIFQVIGKSTIIECTPGEIAFDDKLLEGFSKKDIRAIMYFAYDQMKMPKYKIIVQEFCDSINRILFKLKKRDSNEIFSKTAAQISLDKNLIGNLSHEDACRISFAAGYENSYPDTQVNTDNREDTA